MGAKSQVYEVILYLFLPPGVEAKDSERPFSQIWTATALHTPKIPLHALSTPYAPTMLEGHFNTCLQVWLSRLEWLVITFPLLHLQGPPAGTSAKMLSIPMYSPHDTSYRDEHKEDMPAFKHVST